MKKSSEYQKKWRADRKLKGLCISCSNPTWRPGARFCQFHLDKSNQATIKFREAHPEKSKEYWQNKIRSRKEGKKPVCRCGSTENLTYSEKDVLCQPCRWTQNGQVGGKIGSQKRWEEYYKTHPKVEKVKIVKTPKTPKNTHGSRCVCTVCKFKKWKAQKEKKELRQRTQIKIYKTQSQIDRYLDRINYHRLEKA